MALNLAPFGRWTLRDKASQRRLGLRYVSVGNGGINMRIAFTLLMSLVLASCETIPVSTSALPSSFTTENIMKVHQGMSSGEILQLFGEPKSINSAVCGRAPNQWICTTWKYGEFPYDRASFTFSGEHGSYILNNFDVDRD
ncbi:MAG: hypothetical protein KKF58_01350 [Gammaproteobacteria bacterium]|nr:hypothetical protein [Gammaproteobacteria bacterium]MBU1446933.1 hypothetical protein [Gammaproteobacteria bacterium]